MALPLTGCIPSQFVIDVRPASAKLTETTVDRDTGANRRSPKIALIHVSGLLTDSHEPQLIGAGDSGVDALVARLKKAEEDPKVKAIILRINSPGGTVTGSGVMYDEVRRFKQRSHKPVVASLGEVAASGGYYLALSADAIIAHPTTATGSVGVIIQTLNLSEAMAKIGVDGRSITSGPNKAMGSPFEPRKPEHDALLQSMVDEFYAKFSGLVRERRSALSDTDAAWALDGRVITGKRAAEIHLIDATGGLRDAFEEAKRLAATPSARLVTYHAKGFTPRTPYAAASLPPAAAHAAQPASQINLFQFNLPQMSMLSPGFYYLWRP